MYFSEALRQYRNSRDFRTHQFIITRPYRQEGMWRSPGRAPPAAPPRVSSPSRSETLTGRRTGNFNGNVNESLDASADIYMGIPQYVFATPVVGGQAAIAAAVPYGR